MSLIKRARVEWAGLPAVGGGLSTFYFGSAHTGFTADLTTFFTAIKGHFPTSLTWTIPNVGDVIEDQTGDIESTWTDGTTGVVVGNGTSNFTAGAGCRVKWNTAGRRNNRRVKGSTFLVPLVSSAYNAGAIDGTIISGIQTAATAFLAANTDAVYVWSRPGPGLANGSSNLVVSATVPSSVTSLRSRRT